jgi:hypothetical protein
MKDATHIHIPSGQSVRIKKVYGDVATCYVEPYPISITWGKEEYSDSIIVKTQDLKLINNPKTTER